MQMDDRWRDAAKLLNDHWQESRQIDDLPDHLRPSSRAEGYAVQGQLEELIASPLMAWKIAATSAAGQAHINVDGPLIGRIFEERVLQMETSMPLQGNNMRVAEPEFAFRLGCDLRPQDAGYAASVLPDKIAALHPAIELPASRFIDYCVVGAPGLIADNACANLFVFGDPFPDNMWRDRDLAAWEVSAEVAGRGIAHGIGRNVLGGPWTALHWFVNECSEHGIALKEGQLISTGTCAVPVPVTEGDHLHVDYGDGQTLSIQFA